MPGKDEQQFREWIEGIRKKNPQAENDLARYFEPIVRSFIARKISDRSLDDRNDLLQEVQIDVLNAMRTGKMKPENAGALPTYVYTIAKNKMSDYLKREIKEREIKTDLNGKNFVTDDNPETEFENKETRKNLINAMQKLPQKYKQPIIDRYIHQKKRSEIRKTLGLKTDQQVSDLISYGFEQLRKLVSKKEFSNLFIFLTFFPV